VFTDLDTSDSQHVAVVNETMAKFWAGDRDPIGMTLAFKGNPKDLITIVGVVQDTHQMNLREAPPRTVYSPITQAEQPPSGLTLEIRTAQEPAAIVAAVREAVRGVNRSIVIRYVRTIDQQINASLVRERVLATLSAGFAFLALTLCAIGLYGVMSYTVTRCSREIGIRMALGARARGVAGQVVREAGLLVVAGLLLAAPAAWWLRRSIESELFGVKPSDPQTIAAAAAGLLAVGLLAAALPARRAARVSPMTALRDE
jgi:hypothetical protein